MVLNKWAVMGIRGMITTLLIAALLYNIATTNAIGFLLCMLLLGVWVNIKGFLDSLAPKKPEVFKYDLE